MRAHTCTVVVGGDAEKQEIPRRQVSQAVNARMHATRYTRRAVPRETGWSSVNLAVLIPTKRRRAMRFRRKYSGRFNQTRASYLFIFFFFLSSHPFFSFLSSSFMSESGHVRRPRGRGANHPECAAPPSTASEDATLFR